MPKYDLLEFKASSKSKDFRGCTSRPPPGRLGRWCGLVCLLRSLFNVRQKLIFPGIMSRGKMCTTSRPGNGYQ